MTRPIDAPRVEATDRKSAERELEALVAELRRPGQNTVAVHQLVQAALGLSLVEQGLAKSASADVELDRWAAAAWTVTSRLALDPFVRIEDLAEQIDANVDEMRRLSNVVAGWDAGQEIIMSAGPATKYWKNTIAPLLQSGAMDAALDRRSAFPLRIGLYPGLSCMFHCQFCGRVPGARYDRSAVDSGHEQFVALFDSAPSNDAHRFYISGGLEPLTNPRIGELVAAGASRGFKLSLYTNALLLTPLTLARQPGLWDLDILRISLYGVDHDSAFATTGHLKSFDKVVENVVSTLRLREEVGSKVRIGLNHVIVGARADVVASLVELVQRINAEAGTRRGVDFLTLREDYSAIDEGALTPTQREDLRVALSRLQEQSSPDGKLPGLVVDLGYALDPLLHSWPADGLRFAALSQLRPGLHPQVSVAIDVLGDVYAYREAAFPERPGGDRYIIGRIGQDASLQKVMDGWTRSGRTVTAIQGDLGMLDIFDHVVTLVLDGAEADASYGVPPQRGPIRAWRETSAGGVHDRMQLAHPFPATTGRP